MAAGCIAVDSLRGDGGSLPMPSLDPELIKYFDRGQTR